MYKLFMVLIAIFLAGCASTLSEQTVPDDPDFAPVLPEEDAVEVIPTGSLFNTHYANNLYSDIKAHQVGDIIIVNLVESTKAKKSANSDLSKDNTFNMGAITGPTGPITIKGQAVELGFNQSSAFAGGAGADQSNSLQGSISVSVVRVLSNGNLLIRGEKWLMLNNGDEFIRLTGMIRPDDIGRDNEVNSQRIANARIKYGATGDLANTQEQGWLSSFFNGPFWPI